MTEEPPADQTEEQSEDSTDYRRDRVLCEVFFIPDEEGWRVEFCFQEQTILAAGYTQSRKEGSDDQTSQYSRNPPNPVAFKCHCHGIGHHDSGTHYTDKSRNQ